MNTHPPPPSGEDPDPALSPYARPTLADRFRDLVAAGAQATGADRHTAAAGARLARGRTTALTQALAWLNAADLTQEDLTQRAKDRIVERTQRRYDELVRAERERRDQYGPGYRMSLPPAPDPNPTPTTGEIAAERRRARFTRWGGLVAGVVLGGPLLVRSLLTEPLLLLAVAGTALLVVWQAGGAEAAQAELEGAPAAVPTAETTDPGAGQADDDSPQPAGPAGPAVSLLKTAAASQDDGADATSTTATINKVLADHDIPATVTGHVRGPAVTRYLVALKPGTPVSKITRLSTEIGMACRTKAAPWVGAVPGESRLAVEIPNKIRDEVRLGEILRTPALPSPAAAPLLVAIGSDVDGAIVVADTTRLPHLLVGGATGAGKSVFLNSLICSPLSRGVPPEQLRMVLIDPKRVELAPYAGLPHLACPVITDAAAAVDRLGAIAGEGGEMDRRYELLARNGVKNIAAFNALAAKGKAVALDGGQATVLPYLLVVIDELADLMIIAGPDVETHVVRAAQLARAAGIHLVIGTQRPSVDVVTGLIKANLPSRLAFACASATDSRVILDRNGAELLLGAGDGLFLPMGAAEPQRVQGALVSDEEITNVVTACKTAYGTPLSAPFPPPPGQPAGEGEDGKLLEHAAELVVTARYASTAMLQRKLRLRHARAAELMDALHAAGIVGPQDGTKPRTVLITTLPEALERLCAAK